MNEEKLRQAMQEYLRHATEGTGQDLLEVISETYKACRCMEEGPQHMSFSAADLIAVGKLWAFIRINNSTPQVFFSTDDGRLRTLMDLIASACEAVQRGGMRSTAVRSLMIEELLKVRGLELLRKDQQGETVN